MEDEAYVPRTPLGRDLMAIRAHRGVGPALARLGRRRARSRRATGGCLRARSGPVTRTYVDAGVLIAAATGRQLEVQPRAIAVLDDPSREFVSSEFVRLEVLPKAVYAKQLDEVAFYERFFASIVAWAQSLDAVVARAYREGVGSGLAAMDALHVAVAAVLGAAELVTTEAPGKPIHRATAVAIVSIHPSAARQR